MIERYIRIPDIVRYYIKKNYTVMLNLTFYIFLLIFGRTLWALLFLFSNIVIIRRKERKFLAILLFFTNFPAENILYFFLLTWWTTIYYSSFSSLVFLFLNFYSEPYPNFAFSSLWQNSIFLHILIKSLFINYFFIIYLIFIWVKCRVLFTQFLT